MIIKIAEKLQPFTHRPGTKIPVPGSHFVLQVFPTLLRVFEEERMVQEIPLQVQGPVKEFTAQLDLEKGVIHIWGRTFRITVFAGKNGIQLRVKKGKLEDLGTDDPILKTQNFERLSLGSHKAQDWEGVIRRNNPIEYFPFWYRLGQMIPSISQELLGGTLSLLKSDFESLNKLWLAGFEGMMTPRLEDTDFQGFNLPSVDPALSAMPLLSVGWKKIRELFFQETEGGLSILPQVPKEFHCGRLIGLNTTNNLTLNIEWSKKQLRRMEIYSASSQTVKMIFPKSLKSYRLEKQRRVQTDTFLELEKGKWVILDNFRK